MDRQRYYLDNVSNVTVEYEILRATDREHLFVIIMISGAITTSTDREALVLHDFPSTTNF